MNFNDYQRAALRTANIGPERARRDRLANWALGCLLYTSPSPRDRTRSRMPSSA